MVKIHPGSGHQGPHLKQPIAPTACEVNSALEGHLGPIVVPVLKVESCPIRGQETCGVRRVRKYQAQGLGYKIWHTLEHCRQGGPRVLCHRHSFCRISQLSVVIEYGVEGLDSRLEVRQGRLGATDAKQESRRLAVNPLAFPWTPMRVGSALAPPHEHR